MVVYKTYNMPYDSVQGHVRNNASVCTSGSVCVSCVCVYLCVCGLLHYPPKVETTTLERHLRTYGTLLITSQISR